MQQRGGGHRSRSVIQALTLVIDINGKGSGYAGNISADHEHHAELTQRMCKTQNETRENARPRLRNDHSKERFEIRHTQHPGSLDVFALNCTEGCGNRLDRKRKTVKDGRENETVERERQAETSQWTPRPQRD